MGVDETWTQLPSLHSQKHYFVRLPWDLRFEQLPEANRKVFTIAFIDRANYILRW